MVSDHLAGAVFSFSDLRADATNRFPSATINSVRVKLRLRTGDKAILAGAAAIAVYELVVDDDDLITRRCQAYRSTPVGRILFDTWLIVTAMHLVDAVGVFRCGSSALSPC